MKQEAFERAMKILGPLEENPKGQLMSLTGAKNRIQDYADWYTEEMGQSKKSLRPKSVRDELLKIAEKADELRKSLRISDDTRHILAIFYLMLENPQDIPLLDLIDDYDHPKFPGSPTKKVFNLKSRRFEDAASNEPTQRPHMITYSPNLWIARLDCLEAFTRAAAENPRLQASGGGSLRAMSKFIGTPNQQLVSRCRALLAACGRKHGGSKDGALVKLLSAVAGKDESVITSFNNDIRKVLSDPLCGNKHQAAVARLLLGDLGRRGRPVDDPDVQELEERLKRLLAARATMLEDTTRP